MIHVTDWRNGLPAVVVLSGQASDQRAKRKATPQRDGLNLVGVL
ncbi:hypothetical protein SynA1562_01275 [Synechococcus sp. A15-62]|nr:hypothetical protein SynA1562_01275 [Synechococcus sp. A15-62]